MNEQEVLEAISNGDSAYGVMKDRAPQLERKFRHLCKNIRELLKEAQQEFPDAQYYTASGGFNLMLGRSHDDHGRSHSELVALCGEGVSIGDGDF